MSFGGFLGIGESYHPLPWRVLTYDVNLGGYLIDIIDRSQLEKAPRYTASSTPEWNRDYRARSTITGRGCDKPGALHGLARRRP